MNSSKEILRFTCFTAKVCISIVLVCLVLGCSGSPVNSTFEYVPGQLIVRFNDDVTYDSAKVIIESYNLTWQRITYSGSVLVGVPKLQEKIWAAILSNDPDIRYAEPNYIAYALETENQ